eukprot:1240105-Pyramimonas_sp.AAC.1
MQINPSRGRDPARLARAMATGDQPIGHVGLPLVAGGGGPSAFLEDMRRVKHPLETPPQLPLRLVDAMETICSMDRAIIGYREGVMKWIRGLAQQLSLIHI